MIRDTFTRWQLPVANQKLVLVQSSRRRTGAQRRTRLAVRSGRNLGVDFTLQRRRVTKVFDKRFRLAAARVRKLRQLRAAGARVDHLLGPMLNSSATYGVGCLGASPHQGSTGRRSHRHHQATCGAVCYARPRPLPR